VVTAPDGAAVAPTPPGPAISDRTRPPTPTPPTLATGPRVVRTLPRCLAAWLRLGARVRFADGPLPCEGEVGIRRVPEPAEYATLSPEHEDYPRAQIAHR
jgi:hypothetical protein